MTQNLPNPALNARAPFISLVEKNMVAYGPSYLTASLNADSHARAIGEALSTYIQPGCINPGDPGCTANSCGADTTGSSCNTINGANQCQCSTDYLRYLGEPDQQTTLEALYQKRTKCPKSPGFKCSANFDTPQMINAYFTPCLTKTGDTNQFMSCMLCPPNPTDPSASPFVIRVGYIGCAYGDEPSIEFLGVTNTDTPPPVSVCNFAPTSMSTLHAHAELSALHAHAGGDVDHEHPASRGTPASTWAALGLGSAALLAV